MVLRVGLICKKYKVSLYINLSVLLNNKDNIFICRISTTRVLFSTTLFYVLASHRIAITKFQNAFLHTGTEIVAV